MNKNINNKEKQLVLVNRKLTKLRHIIGVAGLLSHQTFRKIFYLSFLIAIPYPLGTESKPIQIFVQKPKVETRCLASLLSKLGKNFLNQLNKQLESRPELRPELQAEWKQKSPKLSQISIEIGTKLGLNWDQVETKSGLSLSKNGTKSAKTWAQVIKLLTFLQTAKSITEIMNHHNLINRFLIHPSPSRDTIYRVSRRGFAHKPVETRCLASLVSKPAFVVLFDIWANSLQLLSDIIIAYPKKEMGKIFLQQLEKAKR